MADIGTLCLLLALATSAWAVLASFNGWLSRSGALVLSGERAAAATWGLVAIAIGCLEYLIFTDRFDIEYVASYSNRALPAMYKVSALWAGQAGSILFWTLILCAYAALVVRQNRARNRPLMPVVVTTLGAVATFFLIILNFMAPPFVRLSR